MKRFLVGHATHPQWPMALSLAAAQIEAARGAAADAVRPTLGWVYLTDHFAPHAPALLDELRRRWPTVAWVGAVGVAIAAEAVEYDNEPALALMLAELPVERFRIFNGRQPLRGFTARTAMVHADPHSLGLSELIADLAGRTTSGHLFGGIASSRMQTRDGSSTARHIADGVWQGGVSGVAFDREVALVSRISQGCQPIGPTRAVTAAGAQVVLTLDGRPALDCLLEDLALGDAEPRSVAPRLRQTLVGLRDAGTPEAERRGAFGAQTRVRHLIGLDPARRAIAIADTVETGMLLAFCRRDTEAARRDLVRMCAEVREEVETEPQPLPALTRADPRSPPAPGAAIAGALYVSCAGRGGAHFGAPSAELAIVRHALGDVPLVGFFAAGEIAHHHVYGYTGVLTVFCSNPPEATA